MAAIQIALIRGINVGKAKRVTMSDLRELCLNLGFTGVKTLLNSGNIVFAANRMKPEKSASLIEDALFESVGISAKVIVITAADLSAIIKENSIAKLAMDPSRLLVSVLADPSDAKKLKPLEKQNWKPEALAVGKRAVYQWCPDGILAGKTIQTVARELGDAVTARNWSTILKLDALANEA
jgi:uncharacterized protein (DUF1697 family)